MKKLNKKYLLIASIILIAWLIFVTENKTAQLSKDSESNHNVKTEIFQPVAQDIIISSYGVIDSLKKVSIFPEINGIVKKKFINDKEYVKKGTPIIEIEAATKESQLEKAIAAFKQREIEYNADEKLYKKGYVSSLKLSSTFAALKAAEDDLNKAKDFINKSIVTATISGMINKINVSEGDFVTAGNTLITQLIGLNNYIVTCYISESDILKVRNNSSALIELENGDKINGNISFISNLSEANTKTYRIDVSLVKNEIRYPLGSTVKVKIKVEQKNAYNIPGSTLVLSDEGILGIKAVINNTIKFIPVEIIKESADKFWIIQNDLPNQDLNLVVLGASFVKEGDLYRVTS